VSKRRDEAEYFDSAPAFADERGNTQLFRGSFLIRGILPLRASPALRASKSAVLRIYASFLCCQRNEQILLNHEAHEEHEVFFTTAPQGGLSGYTIHLQYIFTAKDAE